MDQLLTLADVAALLKVSLSAVRRRVSAGEVKVINVGSDRQPKLRIRASEANRYISAREVPTGPRRRSAA